MLDRLPIFVYKEKTTKKFVSILFVVLVILIMLCACEPTVDNRDNGGADPKVLNTYEKYSSAIKAIGKADTTGSIVATYVNKGTPWGSYRGLDYATPEFYATIKKVVMFDEYTIKIEMKGDEVEFTYLVNSKHQIPAIEDADLIYRELNK